MANSSGPLSSSDSSIDAETPVLLGLSPRMLVLVAVIVPSVIDLISSLLNRAWLSKPIPQELDGIYQPEEYSKAQLYNRKNSTVGLLNAFYDFLIFQAFWWLGGFPALDAWVMSWPTRGFGPIFTGVVYTFVLMIAGQLLDLPFSIYKTFWLEAEFGFNRTTSFTFVKDMLKGFALMILLGAPILSVILYFFMNAGDQAWFYVWLVLSLFQIVMFLIAPVVLMPLFLEMIPLPDGQVIRIIDIKGEDKKDASSVAFLKRIYYEVENVNGCQAFETKDRQFDGAKAGKKLSIWCEGNVWKISEGSARDENPHVYAVSTEATADSPENAKWKVISDGDPDTVREDAPLNDRSFEVVKCDVGQLKADLLEMANKLEYAGAKIFLIDGSTRSEHSNAFCTGMGECRRICLFDSLLGKISNDEIVAILGHEIGHDKLHHTKIGMLQALVSSFIQFYIMGQFIHSELLAHIFYMPYAKVYVGFLLFGIVWGTVEAFLQIPFTVQSRYHEHAADRFSIDADVRYAELLSSGLMKMMRNSKSNLTPHPFKVFLDFSHPPLLTRLRHIGDYKKQRWNVDYVQPLLTTSS